MDDTERTDALIRQNHYLLAKADEARRIMCDAAESATGRAWHVLRPGSNGRVSDPAICHSRVTSRALSYQLDHVHFRPSSDPASRPIADVARRIDHLKGFRNSLYPVTMIPIWHLSRSESAQLGTDVLHHMPS